jgi:hypothetical protein
MGDNHEYGASLSLAVSMRTVKLMIANLLDYFISNDSSAPTSMIDYSSTKMYASSFLTTAMPCVQPPSSKRRLNLSDECMFISRAKEPSIVLLDSSRSCRNIDATSIS